MNRALWLVAGFLIILQWYARFAAAPVVDFVLDDWVILNRAEAVSSGTQVWDIIRCEPDRPVGIFFLIVFFNVFGFNLFLYSFLSYVVHSAFIICLAWLCWLLTHRVGVVMLAGMLFSVLPNLTESYHWPTMIAYGPGNVAMVASACFWLRYAQGASKSNLLFAVMLFAVGVGTYEYGILLPFLLWPFWRRTASLRDGIKSLFPFFAVVVLYFTWRFTRGFGTAHGLFFVPREPEYSLWTLVYNAKSLISWWVGDHMFNSFRNGLAGFALIPAGWKCALYAGNLIITSLLIILFRYALKKDEKESGTPPYGFALVVTFGVLWACCSHAPSLVSWTASRLNYVPAVGVVLAIAVISTKRLGFYMIPAFALLAFAGLFSAQGTGGQWKQSGMWNRHLYAYIEQHKEGWKDKDIIWLDTLSLRNRLSEGLASPDMMSPSVWAHYGNAGLVRGFTIAAMLERISGTNSRIPATLLDTEYGIREEGNYLHWHERYNPARPHSSKQSDVFRIEALDIMSSMRKD